MFLLFGWLLSFRGRRFFSPLLTVMVRVTTLLLWEKESATAKAEYSERLSVL